VSATDENDESTVACFKIFQCDGGNPGGFGLTRALPEGMNRPDLIFPYPMLTIGSFAIAAFAVLGVLGCVLWVR
jgi:hypothetical protein